MSSHKKTILIVEDDKDLRTALSDKLKKEKFEVLDAADGKEGLELATKEQPDLILLDIVMPVMDGLEMLEKLRSDKWGKKADVVLLTNLNDSDKIAEAVKHGAFDYFVKSDIKISDVVSKVREKLGIK